MITISIVYLMLNSAYAPGWLRERSFAPPEKLLLSG